ncbi:MAG: hypothetical protein P1P84_24285 [Deferrisomatales bacterium]|nr:hypothetical protein [Deferrisomatales bacterium]
MKVGEAMKIIDEGWIRKSKGYRVRYQHLDAGELVVAYSPGLADPPLDSDVSARRLAWKLWKATGTSGEGVGENEVVNLTVVDTDDQPVRSYVTGTQEVFNPRPPPSAGASAARKSGG